MFSRLKYKKIYDYDQVPLHLQTNEFILHGYRHDLSWFECFISFFRFHNETLNIWTHFFGVILFIWYLFRDFIFVSQQNEYLFSTNNVDDYVVLLFYVFSIILCMISSTLFHLFSGCSAKVYHTCLQFDLSGIALATLASFCIGLHLLFKYYFYTRLFYQLAIILCIIIILLQHSCKSDDTIDSTGFVVVSVSGFIPVFHWIYLNEYNSNVSYFFYNILIFYLFFGVGIFFFRTKIPERFAPGYFDYIGASHQLWHIFSLGAFYWWYQLNITLVKHYQIRTCNEELNS